MRVRRFVNAKRSLGVLAFGLVHVCSASLILFPGTPSQVADGDPQDISGQVDMIVIDPTNPILVPNTTDLYFSGMVRHDASGTLTFGQAIGLRALVISEIPAGLPGAGTPAVLHNTSGGIVSAASIPWVEYQYASLDPAGGSHMADLAIHFQGPLDTTPSGGTLGGSGLSQELGVSVKASTWWEWAAGQPDVPILAQWTNSGLTNAPITASGWGVSVGDYDAQPGRLLFTLESLRLEAGERFEFPSSIAGGLSIPIPEPGSIIVLTMAAALSAIRRRTCLLGVRGGVSQARRSSGARNSWCQSA